MQKSRNMNLKLSDMHQLVADLVASSVRIALNDKLKHIGHHFFTAGTQPSAPLNTLFTVIF